MLGANQKRVTLATVEILDKPVKSINVMETGVYVCNIKFMQEGQEITVYSRGNRDGSLNTREIPPNHSIVGVYGTA